MWLTLFTVLSTTLSTIAVVFAWLALRVKRIAPRTLHDVRLDMAELAADVDSLKVRMKRLVARVSMQKAREKLPENDENGAGSVAIEQQTGETPDQWKQRMRRQMAEGKISGR